MITITTLSIEGHRVTAYERISVCEVRAPRQLVAISLEGPVG